MRQIFASEAEAKAARDAKLADTDWTQLPDAERRITHRCVEDFRRFRDSVYNAKHQEAWPLDVEWPDIPAIERQEDVIASVPAEPMEV